MMIVAAYALAARVTGSHSGHRRELAAAAGMIFIALPLTLAGIVLGVKGLLRKRGGWIPALLGTLVNLIVFIAMAFWVGIGIIMSFVKF